jgi:hypothetical protein
VAACHRQSFTSRHKPGARSRVPGFSFATSFGWWSSVRDELSAGFSRTYRHGFIQWLKPGVKSGQSRQECDGTPHDHQLKLVAKMSRDAPYGATSL